MEKKVTSHIAMGVMISLILIVISILGYFASLETETWFRWTSSLIFVVAIIYACIVHARQLDHGITFGNLFAFGFKTSAVVTCLMLLFSVLFFLVFPEFKEKAMIAARKSMEERQGITEEQIETGMQFFRKSFMILMVVGIVFVYLIAGLIASLIGAAVAKKNPVTPFDKQP